MMLPRNSPHRTESTLAYNNNNNNGSSLFQRKPLAPINSEFKISKPQHIKPTTHSHTFTTPTPKTRNTATTTTNNNNRNNHQYRNPNLNTSLVFTPTKNSSSSSSSHSSSLLSSSPFVEEPENQPESNHTRATSHYRTTSTSQYKSSANKDASHSLITSSKRKTSTKQTSESTNPKRRTTTTATQNTNNNKILNPSLSSSTIRFSTVSSSTSSSTTSSSSSSHTSPKPQQQLTLDDFEFGKILGKGKLGRVYCVKHKQSGLIFALKVMSKSEIMNLKLEKSLRREIEIQSNLYHINITRLYSWFHDSINIYLLLEYSIEGELYTHLKKLKRFDNIMASNYIFQITQALIFLHQRGIIHRDLKPENIMVSLDNQLKLSDFGWSKKQKQKRLTICGTLDYLPPEMIESKSHDFSVDIWALGILCYELLVGKPPFEAINRNITYEKIAKVDIKYPSNLDVDAIDLISKLVVKDPNKRLSLKEVLNHNWIIKNKPKWPKNIYK
ncbi:Protein kinase domain family protein [Candida albicans]|uniref:Aurora kinase n=1 Tax=Candida albicans TaxID=5476 RepID=A0A8H6C429_CANAX|nr:Protein kinase domain family protein [Candida albicans]